MAAGRQRLLKRTALLLAALALLGLGGSLMLKPSKPGRRREPLAFPHSPRQEEIERQRRRRTLAVAQPPRAPDAPAQPAEPEGTAKPGGTTKPEGTAEAGVRLDPLHVAMAGNDFGVVLEMGPLKDSPLGRMLIGCLSPAMSKELGDLEQKVGVRPLEQIERMALTGTEAGEPVLILTGQLGGFDPSGVRPGLEFEPYGRSARLAADDQSAVAWWEDQLLLLGEPDAVRKALTRLEGAPGPGAANLEEEAYGEVYGTLSWQAASKLLPRELRERFAKAAQRVNLHVDAREDLLLVADVYGDQQDVLQDLASAAGGALALGRLHAVRSEQALLADLLDESRVLPGAGSFQLEMALPLETLAEQLGECARDAAGSGRDPP